MQTDDLRLVVLLVCRCAQVCISVRVRPRCATCDRQPPPRQGAGRSFAGRDEERSRRGNSPAQFLRGLCADSDLKTGKAK